MRTALTMIALAVAAPAIAKPALVTPADTTAIKAAVNAIYAPYRTEEPPAAFDAPIYSADTTALIARWKAATADQDVVDLTEADWLCQCQDWDDQSFRILTQSVSRNRTGSMINAISFTPGFGARSRAQFIMVKEKGCWRVHDLISPDMVKGLRAKLRASIAEAATAQ